MKILHLPLKAQWYEMIESGVKTEEYREIKPHWLKRLLKVIDLDHTHYLYEWRGDIDRHPRYSHYLRIPNKCKKQETK